VDRAIRYQIYILCNHIYHVQPLNISGQNHITYYAIRITIIIISTDCIIYKWLDSLLTDVVYTLKRVCSVRGW
jgi:hypothetical protein